MNKLIQLKNKFGWKFMLYAIPIKVLQKMDSLFKTNRGKQIKLVNDYLMELDWNKEGLDRELWIRGKREQNNTKVFSRELSKDDIVLDLGANEGYFALLESKRVKSVYAIEPISINYDCLVKNIKLNNFNNIKPIKMAIGDKNGFVDMKIGEKMNWCSASDKAYFEVKNIEKVKIKTVDSFISDLEEKPNVLRMDVEGYEYNILKGMKDSWKHFDKILMEFHFQFLTKKKIKEMFDLLEKKGFKIKYTMWDIDIGTNNKFLNKIINYLAEVRSPVKDGVRFYNYNSILKNEKILRGSAGCPNILFEKTKQFYLGDIE